MSCYGISLCDDWIKHAECHLFSSPGTSCREGLLQLDTPEEQILQGQKTKQDTVRQPSSQNNSRSSQSNKPVVIRRSNNDSQHKRGVQDAQRHEEHLPRLAHA